MNTQFYTRQILEELDLVARRMDPNAGEAMYEAIARADRIFVAGAGRSGLAARGFAMRLMHLGLRAYVCGEIATPGFRPDDLLIIVSGSGETESLAAMAGKVKRIGGRIALVTVRPESTIGSKADITVCVPAPTPKAENSFRSIQPMGSLFEQSCFLMLDAIVMELMVKMNETEESMFARHANLE